MKQWTAILLISAGLGVFAHGELDFLLDVRPGAINVGGSGDFKAKGPTSVHGETFTEVEKLSSISTFPNIKIGFGYDGVKSYFELLGSLGVFVNDPFQSIFYGVDAAWQYKYRKNLSIGPHAAWLVFPSPEWTGDADIKFSDSMGGMLGLQITLGYDLLFIFSVDYLYIQPFDVEEPGTWRASDNELDLSGISLQFGMRGRF